MMSRNRTTSFSYPVQQRPWYEPQTASDLAQRILEKLRSRMNITVTMNRAENESFIQSQRRCEQVNLLYTSKSVVKTNCH